MNDEERLDEIRKVLEELAVLAEDHIILVEGLRDRSALRELGIDGEVFMIQSEGGPRIASEYVSANGNKAVVLTDWDRKGGKIASELADQLSSIGAHFDMSVRAKLSALCRKYIKDVESLEVLIERLTVNTIGIKGRI